ncbi:DMT family transporter [Clostridiaceae bacterium 35-E11]
MEYLGMVFALIAGTFITSQGAINGTVAQKVGIFPTIIIPVGTQIVLLLLAVVINRNFGVSTMKLKEIDHGFIFLGISALLGLGIMSLMTYSIMKIGPLVAFTVVIFSQLLSSMIAEHFGLLDIPQHSISFKRISALILMLIATKLFME